MVIKKIKQIIEMFEKSKLSEMEVEFEDIKLSLKKPTHEMDIKHHTMIQPQPVAQQAVEPVVEVEEGAWVLSPLVGIYYESPDPTSKAFVEVGARVKKGDVLCVIEAMKVMNEIKSPHDGVVKEIAVDNQHMVEFNQNLIRIV
jgi:acetyl-CoA carboxylase biotin carboxyl carrier protein